MTEQHRRASYEQQREVNRASHERDLAYHVQRLDELSDWDRVHLAAQRYIETLPEMPRFILRDIAGLSKQTPQEWLNALVAREIASWGMGAWIENPSNARNKT